MSHIIAHPIFHPTTIVLIDDSKDFLLNFSLRLNEDIAYRPFTSPCKALEWINTSTADLQELVSRCIKPRSDYAYDMDSENLFQIDLDVLKSELSNSRRFMHSSVIIVDYDMPGMNGLELCRAVNDPAIKKILLTGVADEKLAVEAFNEGIIDKFLLKHDNNSLSSINEYIESYQNKFFEEKGMIIKNLSHKADYDFLNNERFHTIFEALFTQYNIVEYYLTGTPKGYFMLTREGKPLHLLLLSEEDMETAADIVRDNSGPNELLKVIEQRRMIPYFWESRGIYSPELDDWKRYAFSCKSFDGPTKYYYALVENPDYIQQPFTAYSEYIDTLDASINL